jgi:uncharacterized protein (DUF169 family)
VFDVLSEKAKELFAKFRFDYPPVAFKYHEHMPENVPRHEKKMALCQFVREAQFVKERFYIDAQNDTCFGKVMLGMLYRPPEEIAGEISYEFEMFKSPMIGRQFYKSLPILESGKVNYVEFSRLEKCNFDPDLVIFFCDNKQSDIVLRATSYLSGDFWESISSPVTSCAWIFSYPLISGKVNYISTTLSNDLKRRQSYPIGLKMIAIPHQKLREVITALDTMPWTPIAFREDSESVKEFKRRAEYWEQMGIEIGCEYRPF